MKKSLLKLLSSAYILLISVILIVISAYAWMVISDSPMVGGLNFNIAGSKMWNIPEDNYLVWDGTYADITTIKRDGDVFIITTPQEFAAVMRLATDAKAYSGDISMRIESAGHFDMNGDEHAWTPIKVDGYNGIDVVTIEGNGLNLKDLRSPLFAGGFAGESGIVIKNMTITNSTIVSDNQTGSGAFIDYIDSMKTIVLDNCHLKNSSVSGSRTGGLIGYTTGYNNVNDGAVNTYVTITNCSVDNCQVFGTGTVGGILGHAGANPATFQIIENCTVKNTAIWSTEENPSSDKVGTIVGTANVGELSIVNCVATGIQEHSNYENNTYNQAYGRFVPGQTGKLVIGEGIRAQVYGGFTQLAADAMTTDTQYWTVNGSIKLSSEIRFRGSNIVVTGADGSNAAITLNSVASGYAWPGTSNPTSGFNFGDIGENTNSVKAGSSMTFEGITFNNNKTLAADCSTKANRSTSYTYAYADTVRYTNCVFNGGLVVYGNATISSCSFAETDSNRYCLFLDNEYGGRSNQYTVVNSTFDSGGTAYGALKVADDAKAGATLTLIGSTFSNVVSKPAVYINGITSVITTGGAANTFINCAAGGILAKGTTCTLNGERCMTVDEWKTAQTASSGVSSDTGSTDAGGIETVAPAETTVVPIETTAPPVETTAPPVETTAPPVETTAPPVETTVPVEETTGPAEETTEPSEVTTGSPETELSP